MRTLLHIGMTKAGSTALQHALLASRAALAARGVLYPGNPPGIDFSNHRLMLAGLFDWRGSRTERLAPEARPPSLKPAARAFFEDLRATVAATPPRCLILSSESMFRVLPEGAAARLPGLLAGLMDDLAVVAYLRRPSEHYASRLQQNLKTSYATPQPSAPHYRGVLAQYAGLFGRRALALGLYHRPALEGGDIVADFVARHLAPFGVARADLAEPPRSNAALSAESTDLLRRFRLAFRRNRNDQWAGSSALVAALSAADAAAGAPRPRLRPGIAERVDYARRDPLWLRDRHGIVFPEFDYARLAAGRLAPQPERALALEEILEIDRARQRAVLAALRDAPWAARSPRRAWIDGLLAAAA